MVIVQLDEHILGDYYQYLYAKFYKPMGSAVLRVVDIIWLWDARYVIFLFVPFFYYLPHKCTSADEC
jgi:hypothetical protein